MNGQLSWVQAFVALCALIAVFCSLAVALSLGELLTRLILDRIDHYRDWRFRRRWVRRTPWWRRAFVSRWRLGWRN